MHVIATAVWRAAGVVAVLLLQAYSFAREPGARAHLPPDSFAHAVATQNAILLEHCFEDGVDVNAGDAGGRTALWLATAQADRELIQRLLDAGADANAADQAGVTPLMIAARAGDVQLLQKFIARSAQPEMTDAAGRTAVHYAIDSSHFEAAKILITSMAAVHANGSATGGDLLAMSCESGDAELLRAVLERVSAPLEWSRGTSAALRVALVSKDRALTRLLLSKHAAPPLVEGRPIPLIAQAIATDDRALFDTLLAAGADPNTVIPPGADKDFLRLLGSSYIHDYVKSDEGVTLLMLAAGFAKPQYVAALLEAGADKNRTTTRLKMMALYFAAHAERSRAVQMLLGSGTAPEKLRIEVSLAAQRAAIIKDGAQIFQTACSTGRAGFDTPAGEYVITDKQRNHKSSIYHVDMPFFMRLNCRDFGLHAGAVPRYPASHGCIRLPSEVAQKLFLEIPVGTVVMIN